MAEQVKNETILESKQFPRSNKYDPQWIIANQMGLNPLWLAEWLHEKMPLTSGMRVLDLGCGKALSSIFLAKEYGVQVWAADLWIKPTDNYERIQQAGVEECVFPVHADARSLPFAEGYFDALLCTDAYIYFGTDDLYLDYLHQFVKPGGQIGITVPGFMRELNGQLPKHLLPFAWLSEAVPASLSGIPPKSVREDGTPTNVIHVLDIAWLLPALLITAVSFWRKQPIGYVLGVALL